MLLGSIILLSACWEQKIAPSNSTGAIQPRTQTETYTIEVTKDGFKPSTLTIDMGDTVKFINTDTIPHWPASANHPTHTVYPGSDIKKCGTDEQGLIFDACKGLSQNETFSFTFNNAGTWGYHDHLNAKLFGKIIVNAAADSISTGSVMYFPGNWQYRGYLTRPSRDGKYPALILIHEWWGLNDNIKKLAQDFGNEGYLVLAVDLYGKEATTNSGTAIQMAGEVTKDQDQAFKNLGYAMEYLKWNSSVDPNRIASVGWCFGGGWAYQMAKNDLWVRASVMYYGRFNPEDDLKMMRAQILGHFGEKDTSIAIDSVNEFQAKLKTLSGSTSTVYIYPNVGHGFANEDNVTYDKAAADAAWQRTIDFLSKNVKAE